ncbi:ABC transporter ATP-binding protein [Rhizosphaericola mali]|uniref:ABC transporter ATP-binding protein n=1 Tax=Rhizosphaericola mali TaxID=2545455 RepID=A0A5P2G8H1_9BACT|nr:ATP-binding cassette domain-containing protein [Rhizosphaericola mali]QES90212.1 ABC transporter ATP-binding protein [Rhizosphaericola mali]
MIQFQSFEKKYGKTLVIAVSKLKLTSKIYWIHGKNGSGKSTLLQSIAGMLRFNGDIKIEDYSLKKNPSLCKSWINYAPAEPRYPPFLSGKEIIQLYIQTKNGNIKNVDYLISELGMSNYMDLPISSYSSGMLKKVALVAAFTGDVKWILLDEPFNAIDQYSIEILSKWIQYFHKEKGIGFILTSHQGINIDLINGIEEMYIDNNEIKTTDDRNNETA